MVFENTKNTIFVLSENSSCSLSGVFFVLSVLFRTLSSKIRRTRKTCLVFRFFFLKKKNTKNTKNTQLKEQEELSENTKIVFSVFLKTVLKNSFKT